MPAAKSATDGSFYRLWAASTVGNVGDGIGRVAIVLLAAQLTRDPLAVAVVTALTYLPWLILAIPAGVVIDWYDRRRIAMLAGGLRAVAIMVLTVSVITDSTSLWLLYAVVFLLYACEAFYDNAVSVMVPMVVDRHDLERANSRLHGARLVADRFVGPPVASTTFALAAAYAFGLHTIFYVLAALLLLSLPGSYRARPTHGSEQPRAAIRQHLFDGIRYIRAHPPHPTLLTLVVLVGLGGGMVNAVNVLWALEVLGLSEAMFGVFTLTIAVGALIGSQSAPALVNRIGRGRTTRLSVAIIGVGALVAAVTTSPFVAGAGMVIVGWSSLVFNVVNLSLGQRLTPAELLGRVTGVYRSAIMASLLVGAVAGGAVAMLGGLRLPLLIFGLGCLVICVAMTSGLSNAAVDQALERADSLADQTGQPSSPQQ